MEWRESEWVVGVEKREIRKHGEGGRESRD